MAYTSTEVVIVKIIENEPLDTVFCHRVKKTQSLSSLLCDCVYPIMSTLNWVFENVIDMLLTHVPDQHVLCQKHYGFTMITILVIIYGFYIHDINYLFHCGGIKRLICNSI